MNGNGSDPAVYYAARPVITIEAQERPLLAEVLLVSLLIEETTAGLYRCEARFTNWGESADAPFRFFDGEVLDFGHTFQVEMGAPAERQRLFDGRIMGLEGQFPPGRPPEMTVLAEDRFQDLRMVRHTRTFNDVGDADVVRQLAADHGLTAEVDADGPTYKVLSQLNQSDLAFLRERARAVDAEVWLDDRTLHFQARNRRQGGTITLGYGANLRELTVLADLAHQRTAVHVTGWSVNNKEAIDERADENALGGELGSDRSGSSVLAQAIAEREAYVATPVPLAADEARALAEGAYRARARRFVTGQGIADGAPGLRVGTTVTLEGIGPWFDGDYYTTRVRHVFDLIDGYRTLFDVERAGLGEA